MLVIDSQSGNSLAADRDLVQQGREGYVILPDAQAGSYQPLVTATSHATAL